ncbi:MAG: hypothetical protein II938_02565 [Alphaproteobacteria bacterium]|nr:hypothetical protein [Alphaproteobacteria bacterium]
MRNTESGRSMVEMLGVLAIIGVLSVGGIAGYTMAMKNYKANEIINSFALAAMAINEAGAGANLGPEDLAAKGIAMPPGCTAGFSGGEFSGIINVGCDSTADVVQIVRDKVGTDSTKNVYAEQNSGTAAVIHYKF